MRTIFCQERLMSVTAIVFLALLACPGISRAGDIIVDQANPNADDRNAGTMKAPMKTIQAALDKAQAGDSVEVRGGVYREGVKFRRGGSYSGGAIEPVEPHDLKWLTLEAYKGEHVVLNGTVEIPAKAWKLVDGCKTRTLPISSTRAIKSSLRWFLSATKCCCRRWSKIPIRRCQTTP